LAKNTKLWVIFPEQSCPFTAQNNFAPAQNAAFTAQNHFAPAQNVASTAQNHLAPTQNVALPAQTCSFTAQSSAFTATSCMFTAIRGKAAEGSRSPRRWRVERRRPNGAKRLGVRRQSGSGDGAFGRVEMIWTDGRASCVSKAVSRCACHRSPI